MTLLTSTPDLELCESQVTAYRISGKAALDRGNTEEAIRDFEEMTRLAPNLPVGYMLLATANLKVGRLNEAIDAFKRAAQLVPTDMQVQKTLAMALRRAGKPESAIESLRAALRISPADLDMTKMLAEALVETNQISEALDCVVQLMVLSSNDTSLLQAYETLCTRLNRSESAARARHRLTSLIGAEAPAVLSLAVANVEITTFCNLKCTGCCRTVGVQGGTWKNKHMSLEQFQKVVNDLPPTGLFIPYGIGEPMLHPQIFEIVRIAKATKKFQQVMLTSNALSRPIEDYHRLFELGLNRLCISVDSLDPELIDQVRPGTDVVKLADRVRALVSKFPGQVEVRSVVGKNNLHALSDLLAALNKFGRMDAYFQPYDDVGNSAGCMTTSERLGALKILENGASLYPNLHIVPQNFIPAGGVCSMPWDSPFITADGRVTPCCRVADANIASFGNALETSFQEVWNGPKTQAWREDFTRRSAAMCKGCPMYVFRKEPAAHAVPA